MKLITLDEINIVGIKVKADWKGLHVKMPEAWKRFSARLDDEVHNQKGDIMTDVSLDMTDGIYTQLVGVETKGAASLPEAMESAIIPPQQYLTCRHKGPVQEIAASFGKMYDWAKGQDIELGAFKIDRGSTRTGDEQEHDLFIKIVNS